MKKAISLILVFLMCLTLCACGKSQAVKEAEALISAIGEVSPDSTDAIAAAGNAYRALSDKEKEKVGNADALHGAAFASLAARCSEMNRQCSILAEGVTITWENVGGSDFWSYFGHVLRFTDLNVIPAMKLANDLSAVQLSVWHAGFALDKKEFGNGGKYFHYWDYTDEILESVAAMCMPYAKANQALPEMESALNNDVTQFINDYKNDYPEEAELLKQWMLESSMFMEFATEPSGKLDDYKAQLAENEKMMSRFQKEAEMLES